VPASDLCLDELSESRQRIGRDVDRAHVVFAARRSERLTKAPIRFTKLGVGHAARKVLLGEIVDAQRSR
jgi:hypothetical protein